MVLLTFSSLAFRSSSMTCWTWLSCDVTLSNCQHIDITPTLSASWCRSNSARRHVNFTSPNIVDHFEFELQNCWNCYHQMCFWWLKLKKNYHLCLKHCPKPHLGLMKLPHDSPLLPLLSQFSTNWCLCSFGTLSITDTSKPLFVCLFVRLNIKCNVFFICWSERLHVCL